MVDFISLGNIIFKDRFNYKYVTDEDKEKNFFILNRKFAYKDIKKAQFFNNKNIDKASALDVWFNIFSNMSNIPGWYWKTKIKPKTKKQKISLKKDDINELKDKFGLSDFELQFLYKYHMDDIMYNIKQLKKFKKKDTITNGQKK